MAHSGLETDEFERLAKSSCYFFSRTNETHYIIIVNKIYKRKEKNHKWKEYVLFYQTNAQYNFQCNRKYFPKTKISYNLLKIAQTSYGLKLYYQNAPINYDKGVLFHKL